MTGSAIVSPSASNRCERPRHRRARPRRRRGPRREPGRPRRRAPERRRARRRGQAGRGRACRARSTPGGSGRAARRRPRGRTRRSASPAPSPRRAPSRMPRSRASLSIQAASAPSFGDSIRRTAPPAALIASASFVWPGYFAPLWLCSTMTSALPSATSGMSAEQRVAILDPDRQGAGVRDDRERPAAEHHRRRDPAVELADLGGGVVAVAAQVPALERLAAVGDLRANRSTRRSSVRSSSPKK